MSLITDVKRIGNINIMLSKFKKYQNDQLKTALIEMDSKIANADNCQTLLQYVPDQDEYNRAKDFDGNLQQLDQPSKFFVMVSQIPHYEVRLRSIIFESDYPPKVAKIEKECAVVNNACSDLKKSENFKKFLKVVLDVGNHMNSGTNKGQA